MRLSSITCLSLASIAVLACSGSGASVQPPAGSYGGSFASQGGDASTGGVASQGGVTAQGQGGAATGGEPETGGGPELGGSHATGGKAATGGAAATGGRTSATGGRTGTSTGGSVANTGGVVNPSGGASVGNGGTSAAATGGRTSTGGANPTGGTTAASTCADIVPQGTPCATWKEWGQCGSSWFTQNHFCESTCNSCSGTPTNTGGAPGTGGAGPGSGGTPATGGSPSTGGNAATGGSTNGTCDKTKLNSSISGSNGWASRYWDCCKPSCSWTTNVPSCQKDGTSRISSRDTRSGCDSGGSAFECYDFSPWYDCATNMAYGFVAHNNVPCGTCYQLQFTGDGHSGASPGAQKIKGRQMIVQVINIGGINNDQFDLLIPGGGVGAMTEGCKAQWGNVDMGATYGGLYANSGGDCNAMKNKCQSVFGSWPELLKGCLWFTDWYECADNPNFVYKQVSCPSQITQKTGVSG